MTEKTCVISGGSRGLGLALVRRFLAEGFRVATFSRSQSPELEALRASEPHEENLLWRPIDGCERAALGDFVGEVVARFGRVDVLVNNAGVGLDGLLTLTPPRDIERTLALNLAGVIALTQLCAKPMLRQRGGCIVNITSVNAIRGHSGVAVYSATKAALDGLTRSLARELGPSAIRVNSVAPGYFESDMVAGLSDAQRARIARRTPLGRLATVDDVTGAVAFLASGAASFITGQTLVVDGGITC